MFKKTTRARYDAFPTHFTFPEKFDSRNNCHRFDIRPTIILCYTSSKALGMLRAIEQRELSTSMGAENAIRLQDLNIWFNGCNTEIFEKQAALTPRNVALISRRGVLSYEMLNAKANRLGWYLASIGVGPETVVGVSLERGIDYIVSMLAIWKAGGAYLPLDISLPQHRLHYMVSDSAASYIISTSDVADKKGYTDLQLHHLRLDDPNVSRILDSAPITNLLPKPNRDDLAYVIYTSGTSGNPKGVAVTHYSIPNMALDQLQSQEITSEDRVMLFSRFCFDASLRDIHGALLNGASLYVPEEEEVLPGKVIETLRDQNITYVVLTPSILRTCAIEPLPHLGKLGVAGEAADCGIIRDWGKERVIINAYGPTEATVCCSKKFYNNGHMEETSPISIGKPILNTEMHIIDSVGNVVQPGEVGEIFIKGPGVSRRGYLNLPAYTSERFSDDLIGCGRGYKSGDLGRLLPNGEIQCLGRKDGQVKLNGQRIEIEEVEKVIRSHQSIQDTVVTVRGPSGAQSLAAYVISTELDASSRAKRELRASLECSLQEHLPPYSVPSTITFVRKWPRSAANKVDIKALPDPTATRDDDSTQGVSSQLSALQTEVARLVLESLSLPSDLEVTTDTTYAQLGGTSLQAQLVLMKLNNYFGCNLHIGNFYSNKQTLAGLAEMVSHTNSQEPSTFYSCLAEEARLPHDIVSSHLPSRQCLSQKPLHILLTGATGYLGSHILSELLSKGATKVTCIVRLSGTAASCRVQEALQSRNLWRSEYCGRFEVVAGDLGKPFMGLRYDTYARLASNVDTIWHCAAAVNFVQPYTFLKEANVTGTIEILRFASTLERKQLYYFSTLAVFFGADDVLCGEEASCEAWSKKIPTGYAQSKWVAEQLVQEFQQRGGDAVILRPGRLLGNASDGLCPADDMTVRLLSSFVETGFAPDLDWNIDFTPVNICSQAAIGISAKVSNGIFHIINPESTTLRQIVKQMNRIGIRIRQVPYHDWKQCARRSTKLRPLISLIDVPIDTDCNTVFDLLLQNQCFRQSAFSTEKTATILEDTGSWEFPRYSDLLRAYLANTILKTSESLRPFTVDVSTLSSKIVDTIRSPMSPSSIEC
ncbi:MAG: hypothetical protein Q9227_000864 [Pyrenula ochraceoflavens]